MSNEDKAGISGGGPERTRDLEKSENHFAGMTEKEAAAKLQETMTQLMDSLQRMENNYQIMLHMSDESILEGGTEHGSD